ncbi:NUDIX hydrolase [Halobacillus litoralis]|uniref:NUDIX hydrolase n=1 Tax=Halobacillus litoralis TaxID=45668 RepID=UPI001CFF1032|nr:NUDIX domain-containing protein [Halobacillus litoralis]
MRLLDKQLGMDSSEKAGYPVKQRTAVRAVLIQDGKILMVKSNRGDYKLPGGGVEEESTEEALIREIAEETGFLNCTVHEYLGGVVERHIDIYDASFVFEMTSHYYLCEWYGDKGSQQLEEYEAEEEYTPVWVDVNEAVSENERVLSQSEQTPWITRENYVLAELRDSSLFQEALKPTY